MTSVRLRPNHQAPGRRARVVRLGSARGLRLGAAALTLVVALSQSAGAQAADDSTFSELDRARATELYHEGTVLMSRQHYAEAAQRFQRSLELLHGRGTLLNLAICREHLGQLVTAWREFEVVRRQAEQAQDTARYEAAREHLAWLEPQLSFISITFSERVPPGVQVELDGLRLREFGALQPVLAGRHRLNVTAEGKLPWTLEVVIARAGERALVSVPPLTDVPAAQPAEAAPSGATPPLPHLRRHTAIAAPKPSERHDLAPIYIAGTATAVFASGALISSILYYQRRAEYYDRASASPAEERSRLNSAVQMDWINRVFVTGAAVGAGVTGYLVYRAIAAQRPSSTAAVWGAPWVSNSGAGVAATGRF